MGKKYDMDKWEEFLAKWILEDHFPFGKFEKSESPDLIGRGIGVEVVKAYLPALARVEGEYMQHRLAELRCVEAASRKHYEKTHGVWNCEWGTMARQSIKGGGELTTLAGNLGETQVYVIVDAVKRKLEKVKKYQETPVLGLFVYTSFSIEGHLDELAKKILETSQGFERWFEHIFLFIDSQSLIYRLELPSMKWSMQKVNRHQYDERLTMLDRGN